MGMASTSLLRLSETPARPSSGQLEWSVTNRPVALAGLRLNIHQKDVDFDQQVYGGLETTDPVFIALQPLVLARWGAVHRRR